MVLDAWHFPWKNGPEVKFFLIFFIIRFTERDKVGEHLCPIIDKLMVATDSELISFGNGYLCYGYILPQLQQRIVCAAIFEKHLEIKTGAKFSH